MAAVLDVPGWAVPSPRAVADATILSCAAVDATGSPRAAGRVAAFTWATHGGAAPLGDTVHARPPTAHAASAMAGVAVRAAGESAPMSAQFAEGVSDVLTWLLGWAPAPGIDLPLRAVDGRPLSASEVYATELAGQPHRRWSPEQRRDAQTRARSAAALSAQLVNIIDRASG